MKTRQEKIRFLKRLQTGKLKIEEILPVEPITDMWVIHNDTAFSMKTGVEISLEEYEKREETLKKK